jgi:hypothetical protein
MAIMKGRREYGTNGTNGKDGISLGFSVCSVCSVCSVFSLRPSMAPTTAKCGTILLPAPSENINEKYQQK